MKSHILVALGGAVGAVSRFALSGWMLKFSANALFPTPTFVVNVAGCFLAGLLAGFAERHSFVTPEARLFLLTGVLGGFTTFSAFGVETLFLVKRGEWLVAISYILLSVVVSCGALALAYSATKLHNP